MRKSLAFGPAAILLAASLTGCGEPVHSCLPNLIWMEVPARCISKVTVTASGSACPSAEILPQEDRVGVRPTEAGTCDIHVEFEDGWSYDFSATVRRGEDCSNAPYPIPEHTFVEVPYPGAC